MKDVMITLGEKYIDELHNVAASLSSDGLVINQVYPFGVIKGQANDLVINKMRAHKEVDEVKEEKYVRIAPPESDIQ